MSLWSGKTGDGLHFFQYGCILVGKKGILKNRRRDGRQEDEIMER